MSKVGRLAETCKDKGLKLTPQRLAIFEILSAGHGHITAEEVYAYLIPRFPTVSFNTIYSTLKLLVELEEIRELHISKERVYYDLNPAHHHHVICKKCNRVEDISLDVCFYPPEHILREFQILNQQVQFYGICQKCSN